MDTLIKILDHNRAQTAWVVRAEGDKIIRMARLVRVKPRDGAGRLRVAVTDWGRNGDEPARQFVGHAGGGGYDKLTAAMVGATVGDFFLGDHCDHAGRPTLNQLCQREGWEVIGW